MFHVERGGVVELWGRQFEKYHFSPTCYRGVSVSRGTSVHDVLGLGGLFMGAGLFRSFWFYGDVVVSHGTWAMLVKEIFCDCSHVSWCLKVSRCFT